jgi:hypothetical protein
VHDATGSSPQGSTVVIRLVSWIVLFGGLATTRSAEASLSIRGRVFFQRGMRSITALDRPLEILGQGARNSEIRCTMASGQFVSTHADGLGRFGLDLPEGKAEWPIQLSVTNPGGCGIEVSDVGCDLFRSGNYLAIRIQRLPPTLMPGATAPSPAASSKGVKSGAN